MISKKDTENLITELKERFGEEKTDKLVKYIDMVLERNEHINLTAVRDRDEAMQKHIADSLSICDLEEYKKANRVLDIGTGAGFPGALLAIVSPEKEFYLMDSTLKRLKVIDEFAEKLGLKNITTVHARAEEICRKEGYAAAFDLVVSRAVANLKTLSGWCLPFVRRGGYFVSYKGENYMEEVDLARNDIKKLGGKLQGVWEIENTVDEISGHVLLEIEKIK